LLINTIYYVHLTLLNGGRHGHDHMLVGFITIYAISAYHH